MNQDKIGKLIATLRKRLGLTQSELGAKVGVGDRAVSKWERGITCPDISIINELSKVLGITSDELLSGELNSEHKALSKPHFNKLFLLLIPCFIIVIFSIVFLINKDKSYVYTLESVSSEYDVSGKVVFDKNKTTIIINKVTFNDKSVNKLMVKNYEYNLLYGSVLILRSGYISETDFALAPISLREYMNSFSINYTTIDKMSQEIMVSDGLVLRLTFLDIDDNIVDKEIKIRVY